MPTLRGGGPEGRTTSLLLALRLQLVVGRSHVLAQPDVVVRINHRSAIRDSFPLVF